MKKKTVSAICIALAFIMIVTLVVSLMGSFGAFAAGGQEEIDALEQQKQQLQSQQRSLQERGQRIGDGSKVYHFPAS